MELGGSGWQIGDDGGEEFQSALGDCLTHLLYGCLKGLKTCKLLSLLKFPGPWNLLWEWHTHSGVAFDNGGIN